MAGNLVLSPMPSKRRRLRSDATKRRLWSELDALKAAEPQTPPRPSKAAKAVTSPVDQSRAPRLDMDGVVLSRSVLLAHRPMTTELKAVRMLRAEAEEFTPGVNSDINPAYDGISENNLEYGAYSNNFDFSAAGCGMGPAYSVYDHVSFLHAELQGWQDFAGELACFCFEALGTCHPVNDSITDCQFQEGARADCVQAVERKNAELATVTQRRKESAVVVIKSVCQMWLSRRILLDFSVGDICRAHGLVSAVGFRLDPGCAKCFQIRLLEETPSCLCCYLVCSNCNKRGDDCSCAIPSFKSQYCSHCRLHRDDTNAIFCANCYRSLKSCECTDSLLFMAFGDCEANDMGCDHKYAVSWYEEFHKSCPKCKLVLQQDQQVRCDIENCLTSEMIGEVSMFHQNCLLAKEGYSICLPDLRSCRSCAF